MNKLNEVFKKSFLYVILFGFNLIVYDKTFKLFDRYFVYYFSAAFSFIILILSVYILIKFIKHNSNKFKLFLYRDQKLLDTISFALSYCIVILLGSFLNITNIIPMLISVVICAFSDHFIEVKNEKLI